MPLNTGITTLQVATGDGSIITCQVFYNPVLTGGEVVPENQPIRNVNGSAMVITNTGTNAAIIRVTGPAGDFLGDDGSRDVKVPSAGISKTKAFLSNTLGINTRADLGDWELASPADLAKP
jgi:hypothetical protein